MNDEDLIRDLLSKEEDAVSSYVDAANKCTNEDVRKVHLDIASEEKVHKGELLTLLKVIGVCDCAELRQGEEEATSKIIGTKELSEKIDTRMSSISIIKEIMDSWEQTGKIGASTPENKAEAMKQAAAITYNAKK